MTGLPGLEAQLAKDVSIGEEFVGVFDCSEEFARDIAFATADGLRLGLALADPFGDVGASAGGVPFVAVLQAENSAPSAVDVVEKSTGDLSNLLTQVGLVERDQSRDVYHRIARQTRDGSW